MNRFRIWLATLLCRGTPCIVARSAPLIALGHTATELAIYVEKSGAVASNWKAHKILSRALQGLLLLIQDILVGGSPTLLRSSRSTASGPSTLEIEETSDGEEEKATA